jgi:hypothetical protein
VLQAMVVVVSSVKDALDMIHIWISASYESALVVIGRKISPVDMVASHLFFLGIGTMCSLGYRGDN